MSSSCLTGSAPVALADSYLCNQGFYCPNNTDSNPPEYCAPTGVCLITRLNAVNNVCLEPQGTYEPVICPPGSYCSPGGKEMNKCPKGYYCPLGTVKPNRCGAASICPEGSSRNLVLDGFIVIIIIDLILLFLALGSKPSRRMIGALRQSNRFSISSRSEKDGLAVELARPDVSNDASSADATSLQRFIASVNECVESKDVGISFGYEGLSLVLPSGKTILYPQSGNVAKGSMWGVMGSSGAGKSSFVNVLMGKITPTGGSVYVNGKPCHISEFKQLIGYVPQDDVIMSECTVRENILHSARIRLPSAWSSEQRQNHVDTLIACLDLAFAQDNTVGDAMSSAISGGQRKRVSIGLELAAAPMALFLDEPTSGLDATAALSIMKLLKALSKLGVTIICIIHQPRQEILEFLDGLTLLHKGHQIFHGATSDLSEHFMTLGYDISSSANTADAVLDIVSGQSTVYSESGKSVTVDDLVRHWCPLKSKHGFGMSVPGQDAGQSLAALQRSAASRGAPRLMQAYYCLVRALRQQLYRRGSFALEIGVGAVGGVLIGLSLYETKGLHFQGVYFGSFGLLSSALNYTMVSQIGLLCTLAIGLAAAAPGVKVFGEEKLIYWREASAGHSRSAYYVAKVLSTLPRLLVSAMHFTTFYYILATPWMSFWSMYLTNLLYFYCIYGVASIMSILVSREDGPLMGMIVSLIIAAFNGYGPPLHVVQAWNLEWFWRMCPGTWLAEAFFDKHLGIVGHLYDLNIASSWTGYVRGRFGTDLAMMIVIGTIYRIIAFVALVTVDRRRQR